MRARLVARATFQEMIQKDRKLLGKRKGKSRAQELVSILLVKANPLRKGKGLTLIALP